MTSRVVVRVPAKINLHLSVGPLRPDGFHELCTVFHAVDLCDEVVAELADGLSVSVTGEGAADVPTDERNLAWRAAALLADSAGRAPDVALHLRKAIPVAGGLAGGSADAAGALLACATLWGLDADLHALAADLGSDVAFPLTGGTALGQGRGERITPVPCATDLHWVLAFGARGISAGDAYRELDRSRGPASLDAPHALLTAIAAGDVERAARLLHNDLQPAALALAPELADTLAAGLRNGALAGIVSGSGPTCAFLCADDAATTALADALDKDGVARAVRVVRGPYPGARVVG